MNETQCDPCAYREGYKVILTSENRTQPSREESEKAS